MIDKLLKHRWEEPPPVEQLRPDVPPAVAAVVRKLMAKKPDDRYQTPAELAAVLATVAAEAETFAATAVTTRAIAESRAAKPLERSSDTLASPFAGLGMDQAPAAGPRRNRLVIGLVSGVALLGLGDAACDRVPQAGRAAAGTDGALPGCCRRRPFPKGSAKGG